jgi:hypothetical protein
MQVLVKLSKPRISIPQENHSLETKKKSLIIHWVVLIKPHIAVRKIKNTVIIPD